MAQDREILFEAFDLAMHSSDFFRQERNGPVLAARLFENKHFSLLMHCFLPLPNRTDNVSHNWIHHHDNNVLTSANAFGGEGYRSILFDRSYDYDKGTRQARLYFDREFQHQLHNVETLDAYVPHVIFIPSELTITFAVWSTMGSPQNPAHHRSRAGRLFKRTVERVGRSLRIHSLIRRAVQTQNRQFAPDGDHFVCVGNRPYAASSNHNFVHNFFYALQQTGYHKTNSLDQLSANASRRGRSDTVDLIKRLLANEPIEDRYEPGHLNTPDVNFSREAVLAAARPKRAASLAKA